MFLLRDVQLKSPFNMMVAGPSGSGKAVFVRKLLEHRSILFVDKKDHLKVIWCYGQRQSGYLDAVNNVTIEFVDGLACESKLDEKLPVVIVVDDLMNELCDNVKFANFFTKISHHKNINVIFITQNVFHQGK